MYVCICKAVTDRQIREAVQQGCCTRKDLVRCLEVGRDCGKCRSQVRSLLEILVVNEGGESAGRLARA
jgi:bacterioferritin-associated ferredoxin